MDRELFINNYYKPYIQHTQISINYSIALIMEYCREKGKKENDIHSFIKTILNPSYLYIAYQFYLEYVINYYSIKFSIHILRKPISNIMNYTQYNVLLIY